MSGTLEVGAAFPNGEVFKIQQFEALTELDRRPPPLLADQSRSNLAAGTGETGNSVYDFHSGPRVEEVSL
jgi:hypothetical protein